MKVRIKIKSGDKTLAFGFTEVYHLKYMKTDQAVTFKVKKDYKAVGDFRDYNASCTPYVMKFYDVILIDCY